jgi:hypothetical protein
MSRSTPKDLGPELAFVAADGYAAMFQDAPPPTEDDLRDLETSGTCVEMRAIERRSPEPLRERLRIASVA